MAALGFTWVRVTRGDDTFHPGMYVLAAEVVSYLRQYESEQVIDALERLQADNPPATVSGWVQ